MTLTCISFFRCRVPYLHVHVLLMSYYITKLDLRLGILRLLGGLIFTSWSAHSARTAGPKFALRFPCLCACLFVRPHLSRVQYIVYTCIPLYTCVYLYISVYTCAYMCLPTCIPVFTRVYKCSNPCIPICTSVYYILRTCGRSKYILTL